MGVTSPDSIYKLDAVSQASIVQESQTQAASIQAAFAKRQRYSYEWDDAADRAAQTGMTPGARGYQLDTKSEYIYDNSQWRLAMPYAEFTASTGSVADTPPAAQQPVGVFSNTPSLSTDTSFITVGLTGILRVVRPGIYAISAVADIGAPVTNRTFLEVSMGAVTLQRLSVVNAETIGSLAVPNVFVSVANTDLSFKYYKQTGGNSTVATTVRIARIG